MSAEPPRSQLTKFVCVTALDPPSRAISVTAVMRPVSGTSKLQIKFQLYSRTSSTRPFTRVRGGDLNRWVSPSDPTLGERSADVWTVIKQVVDLKAPATYRLRAVFRWIGVHNQVLGTMARTSASCNEPELRPDLQVKTITVEAAPSNPNANVYVALIRNRGATAAGPFQVQFIDGSVVKSRSVTTLPAHSTINQRFVGPLCTSGPATVTADPVDAVDDYDRANNSLTVTCSSTSNSTLHSRVQ
ncbi:MAG TPA: CARDB domain-containing protein [Solirubrobacteraceae bacterium]|nr:CARDB domain-containing protein [Solirubrobacteraceae bacterium]